MKFDPAIHHRRSIRLRGYDYSQVGAYFVTVCTQNRECLFGEIVDGEIRLNDAGQMIHTVWDEIPLNYPGCNTAEFIVMPNHIHGIVVIGINDSDTYVGLPSPGRPDLSSPNNNGPPLGGIRGVSLPDVVGRLKTMTTKRYANGIINDGWRPFPEKLWQRNYWEHIIRNETDLNEIRQYIRNNPAQWSSDAMNPNL